MVLRRGVEKSVEVASRALGLREVSPRTAAASWVAAPALGRPSAASAEDARRVGSGIRVWVSGAGAAVSVSGTGSDEHGGAGAKGISEGVPKRT